MTVVIDESKNPKNQIIIRHSKFNRCEDICEKVLAEYAARYQKRFELCVFRGYVHPPLRKPREDTIYIYIYSTPVDSVLTKIKEAYGYKLDRADEYAILPSEEGIVISDPNGQELAEIVGRSIYVLFALLLGRKEYMEPILRAILDKALFWILEASQDDKIKYETERKAGEKDRFLRIYGDFEYSLRETQDKINTANKLVEEAQNKLTSQIKHARTVEKLLKFLEKWQDEYRNLSSKEWESLLRITKVKGIKIYSDRLSVFLGMICVKYKNLVFEIGEFKINLYRDGGKIRIWNLTHPELDKNCDLQHPHVDEKGTPCFGNIQEAFPPLIAEFKFGVLAALIVQYLESLNLEDERARRKFFYWPLQGENEQAREKRVRTFEEALKQKCSPKLEENPLPLIDALYCSSEVSQ